MMNVNVMVKIDMKLDVVMKVLAIVTCTGSGQNGVALHHVIDRAVAELLTDAEHVIQVEVIFTIIKISKYYLFLGFCPGPESESRRCNEFACHDRRFFHSQPQQFIDIGDRCVWTTWTNWSGCSPVHHQDCSMGIGRGEHARQRYCVTRDVRQDCGHQCDGGAASSQQREACSLDPRYDPCRRSG